MKKVKSILAAALALCMCFSMAGCGESKKSIDDMTEEDFEQALIGMDNGLDDNSESGESVEAADKLEAVDAFSNLNVTFNGIYPNSSISISGGDSRVTYTASTEKNMKNGDVITVSAELKDRYKTQCELAESSKEYTVEGLSAYAMSLNDIPNDAYEKICSQANDLITANVCDSNMVKIESIGLEDYSFEQVSSELAGYYFLAGKENFEVNPHNKLCCVYKLKYSITAYQHDTALEGHRHTSDEHITGYQEIYTLCELNDIILLGDGTCSFDLSSMKITSDKVALSDEFANYYGYKLCNFGYGWKGYSDIDSMFNKCITSKIDKYTYESTVK